jgi:cell division protein ZapB
MRKHVSPPVVMLALRIELLHRECAGNYSKAFKTVDHYWTPAYYLAMAHDNIMHEAESQLQRLEQRIDELLLVCQRLKDENLALRSQQQALAAQRASLIDKHDMARSRVEAMINRLKSMERGA